MAMGKENNENLHLCVSLNNTLTPQGHCYRCTVNTEIKENIIYLKTSQMKKKIYIYNQRIIFFSRFLFWVNLLGNFYNVVTSKVKDSNNSGVPQHFQ